MKSYWLVSWLKENLVPKYFEFGLLVTSSFFSHKYQTFGGSSFLNVRILGGFDWKIICSLSMMKRVAALSKARRMNSDSWTNMNSTRSCVFFFKYTFSKSPFRDTIEARLHCDPKNVFSLWWSLHRFHSVKQTAGAWKQKFYCWPGLSPTF